MKKIIFVLSIILFNYTVLDAQSSWFWLNPLPTRSGLNDIIFLDSLTGYSCGYNGTVLKTTNGGYNWNSINYFKSIYLNSLYFFNKDTGIILTDDYYDLDNYSEIIRTTNGGLNWNIMYTVNSYKLTKVYFVNQYTGFALSGAIWTVFNSPNSNFILKTTNSGINWRQITIGPSFVMNSISFVNSTTGVIAGSNGIILKSSDAGESWNQIKSGSVIYNDILYKSMDTIIATGNSGVFHKTINGGTNWTTIPISPIKNLYQIKFNNSLTGYIAGGNIFKTTNAGITWDSISIDFKAKNLSFANNSLFYSLGIVDIGNSIYDSVGLIYRSTNSGYTWTNIHSYKTNNVLTGIYMINENTGFISGYNGTVLKTTNGTTWDSIYVSPTGTFYVIKFFNSNTGLIGGYNGILYRTTNQGNNWNSISTGNYSNITSFSFPNSNVGFFSCWHFDYHPPAPPGYGGIIFKTTDLGNTWIQIYNSTSSEIYSISFTDANTGYAVGPYLGIIKTTNSGGNWFPLNIYHGNYYFDQVYFIDSQTGFASYLGTNWNCIFKTTNGGLNWMKVDSTSTLLNEGYQSGNIQFINNLTGYYSQISFPWVGRSGNVLKTTNGGLNWYTLSNTIYSSMLFGSGLRCLQFVNENTGYVVGEYGVILKTTNGGGNLYIGINESSKEIPKSSSLYQNYPNPFNPTTKIRFDIPNDLSVNYKKGLTSFSGA